LDLPNSSGEIGISLEEIGISLFHLCIFLPEIGISFGDLHISLEEIETTPRQLPQQPKRTRSVSEGHHSGSLGIDARAEALALAHASGSFWLFAVTKRGASPKESCAAPRISNGLR